MAGARELLAFAAASTVLLTGCAAEEESPGADDGGEPTFSVITHGAAGDAFWDVVQSGAEAGGEDLGVAVDYQSDGDPQRQAQLVDAAVNHGVDGIVVSMANPDALHESISAAVEAGVPVVTINSGGERSAAFGAIGHVGQDETIAGRGAGQRLARDGARHVVCVVHEAGNVGLEQRCAGAAEGLGAPVTVLQVDIDDLRDAQSTITSHLQSDPAVDAVLALNSAVAAVAVAAVDDAGSPAQVATFDLNRDVIAAIQEGDIAFAVDQQPYEQGYLPIVMLHLYVENLNTVGGGRPVLTGPGIVDAGNVDAIAELAAAGTR
ncbi:MAG TPA: sugar ABC transporter substrate-binding protein [Geodermatophilus sp.]|nr:sugar ABC transporter substrate-binding protein [Geodermatophilus sp.]